MRRPVRLLARGLVGLAVALGVYGGLVWFGLRLTGLLTTWDRLAPPFVGAAVCAIGAGVAFAAARRTGR